MKKLLCLLSVLLIILSSSVFCFAERNNKDLPNVYDEADIFTDREELEILNKCDEIIDRYNLDIAVVVFSKSYGSLMETADAIYDENGYGCGDDSSGSLLYICMDKSDRGWWTTACGSAEKYYTEDNINYIDDNLYNYMASGRYGDGVLLYLDLVDELYANGKFNINEGYAENPGPNIEYSHEESITERLLSGLIAGAGFGVAAGVISLSIAKKSMVSVATANYAGEYLDRSSFNMNIVRDIFLFRTSHRTRIQQNNNSSGSHPGGRSSFSGGHTSHSGVHHSGGGRHF